MGSYKAQDGIELRGEITFNEVLFAQLCLTLCNPWIVAHQAPLSMELSRQKYWSGLPFPSPGDLPKPGIEPRLRHCRQILYQLSYEGGLIYG